MPFPTILAACGSELSRAIVAVRADHAGGRGASRHDRARGTVAGRPTDARVRRPLRANARNLMDRAGERAAPPTGFASAAKRERGSPDDVRQYTAGRSALRPARQIMSPAPGRQRSRAAAAAALGGGGRGQRNEICSSTAISRRTRSTPSTGKFVRAQDGPFARWPRTPDLDSSASSALSLLHSSALSMAARTLCGMADSAAAPKSAKVASVAVSGNARSRRSAMHKAPKALWLNSRRRR